MNYQSKESCRNIEDVTDGADGQPRCAVAPGSPSSACANRYDLAFLDWFREHGWQIHVTPSGVDVWSNDDTPCPFRVTRGMIDRLEWSRKIERIFPYGTGILDYVWVLANTDSGNTSR